MNQWTNERDTSAWGRFKKKKKDLEGKARKTEDWAECFVPEKGEVAAASEGTDQRELGAGPVDAEGDVVAEPGQRPAATGRLQETAQDQQQRPSGDQATHAAASFLHPPSPRPPAAVTTSSTLGEQVEEEEKEAAAGPQSVLGVGDPTAATSPSGELGNAASAPTRASGHRFRGTQQINIRGRGVGGLRKPALGSRCLELGRSILAVGRTWEGPRTDAG